MADIHPIDEMPDEYLREIGRAVVAFNDLERTLHTCLIHALGKEISDSRGHIVFAHMAFPQKLDALTAMIDELTYPPESPLARYRSEAYQKLRGANELRNPLIHQSWEVENGTVLKLKVTARGKLAFVRELVPLVELKKTTLLFQEANLLLYDTVLCVFDSSLCPQEGQ